MEVYAWPSTNCSKQHLSTTGYTPPVKGWKWPNDFVPGPHMVPVDTAAKKVAKEIGLVNGPLPDPIDEITSIGASPKGAKTGLLAGEELPL